MTRIKAWKTVVELNILWSGGCPEFAGLSQAGGLGGLGPPIFGRTVNPISTRGADYVHHSTTSLPPQIFRPCDGPDSKRMVPSMVHDIMGATILHIIDNPPCKVWIL